MEKSESIDKLLPALFKAQGEFKIAGKDNYNPHFKSKYADLISVWDAIRDGLRNNDLGIFTLYDYHPTQADILIVEATLYHYKSGQWVATRMPISAVGQGSKVNPQTYGGACTYGRRYAISGLLEALCGDEANDDDGNAASGYGDIPSQPKTHRKAAKKPAPKKQKTIVSVEGGFENELVDFGKHKDKLWVELSTNYLEWICDNVTNEDRVENAEKALAYKADAKKKKDADKDEEWSSVGKAASELVQKDVEFNEYVVKRSMDLYDRPIDELNDHEEDTLRQICRDEMENG